MRILICDDHALFREGLRHVLVELGEKPEILEASGSEEALALAEANPDLAMVLLDLHMPGTGGLETLTLLGERFPTLPVVMVSASEASEEIRETLDAGASGFIPKSSSGALLRSAVQLVLSGGVYVPLVALEPSQPAEEKPAGSRGLVTRYGKLTPRQLEVLRLLAKGLTNREICSVLGIAEGTVKAHIAGLLDALDVSNRTEAVAAMRELDISTED
ncbi:MAG: response regulator transcription factor [Deltaproteobacteria bacterium]|nr:response regulator transcription factor [Deltaproteobacteria bacterium]MBW2392734.1 response regulator transcription factor [Deltaproteobacteria bacterium]